MLAKIEQLEAAKALVFEFVRAWSDWESQMARVSPPFSDSGLLAAHEALLAKYCTPKKRVYVDGHPSFSLLLTYGAVSERTLLHAEMISPGKVHLDFKCRLKTRRFVLRRTRSGWRLDSLKWLSFEGKWRNGLIGM